MSKLVLSPSPNPLKGTIEVPGDKSISHRAVIFGSLAEGVTKVTHFLDGEDCMRTVHAFQTMGVNIKREGDSLIIDGKGIAALEEPDQPLYFGNSGTTSRLMIGLLAGLPFFTASWGDPSLSKRPMDRVVNPLRDMGAIIDGREKGSKLPLSIRGTRLQSIDYTLPVKSAQVKSAVLFAGLLADGVTKVRELTQTRNHTENMLKAFQADITTDGNTTEITGRKALKATNIYVPGDISSAAFFIAAAAIVPESQVVLKNVGLNGTRTGILDVLKKMGADMEVSNQKEVGGEMIGDLTVKHTELQGVKIKGDIIPRLIDEIPIIALLATQAEGTTVIKDAEELRVKETDRIAAVTEVLSSLGADIEATEDGMVIKGRAKITGGEVSAYNDHRIAMMGAIASLISEEEVTIDDDSSIAISYPNFFEDLNSVIN
ncbi:3-phosphoshikimate 1-carboxyvinyltransferase [Virgibacillus xinjiangensis]|uniref:3-phosphoshikimate 1-carboxyvinyltransferase n=1 Tax=Virgibacillus xinjiangensis TaxID=393090 RepID=A0ABV7CRI4_9BACI